MPSKRRKQQQPRHLIQDNHLLSQIYENELVAECSRQPLRSFDNHVCGRCSAEFYTMPAFLMHKKRCANEWPALIAAAASADANATIDTTKMPRVDACDNDVGRIRNALSSLRHQQSLQMRLIKHIYGRLLNADDATECCGIESVEADANYEMEDATLDALKRGVVASLKELERNVTQQLRDERAADLRLAKLYAARCHLCDENVGDIKKLEIHMKNAHNTELAYFTHFCDECYQCFTSERQLADHSKHDHGGGGAEGSSPPASSSSSPMSGKENHMTGNNNDNVVLQQSSNTATNLHINEYHFPNDGFRDEFSSTPTDAANQFVANADLPLDLRRQNAVVGNLPTMVNSAFSYCNSQLHGDYDEGDNDDYEGIFDEDDDDDEDEEDFEDFDDNDEDGDGADLGRVRRGGDNANQSNLDWETLIEVTNVDETDKIRKIIGDTSTVDKLTDPHQCVVCQRILSCKSALQMHYRTHTGSRPFKCKVCQRAFTTKGNLKTHMSVHKMKLPVRMLKECPICRKPFTNSLVLYQHILAHASDGERADTGDSNSATPVEENTNDTSVLGGPSLTLPLTSSSVEKQKQQNNANFNNILNQSLLANNNAVAMETAPYESYLRSSSLFNVEPANQQHHSSALFSVPRFETSPFIPSGNNPFNVVLTSPLQSPAYAPQSARMSGGGKQPTSRPDTTCNVCFKTFACHSALEIHYRSHTKERPFRCTLCGRGFTTKGNLKQHMLTHKLNSSSQPSTPLGPNIAYQHHHHYHQRHHVRLVTSSTDDDCSKEDKESSDRVGRISTRISTDDAPAHQPDPVMNASPKPNLKITDKDADKLSAAISTDISPLESIKNMWIPNDGIAQSSSSTNPVAGAIDGKTSAAEPADHNTNLLNSSKHQCQVCLKHFSSGSALHIHMRTHTGVRPFVCEVCARPFTTKGNLKVHMTTHEYTTGLRRGRRIFGSASSSTPHEQHQRISKSNSDSQHVTSSATDSPSAGSNYGDIFSASSNQNLPFAAQAGHFHHPAPSSSFLPFFDANSPLPANHHHHHPFSPILADYRHQAFSGTLLNGYGNAGGAFSASDKSLDPSFPWRTVCSVCRKVCGSVTELEAHLKNHLLIQSDNNQQNAVKI